MRCPDCNKFVPYDEPEIEVTDSNVDESEVRGSVRVVLKCAECGNELKDAELEFDMPIEHECESRKKGDPTFEIEGEVDASGTDRFETKDRHGKPIKSMRYQKHYYGADLSCTVKCSKCEKEIECSTVVEEQASGFNELV